MTKGISLHIGLNFVDSMQYTDEKGQPLKGLNACENDARSMQKIASQQGFKSKILISKNATSERVEKEIESAAQRLSSGDIFFLSYAGHGSQIPDYDGDEPSNEAASPAIREIGGKDELFCFYNRVFSDDELNKCLSAFKPGVRVIVISDSCHSGTNIRGIDENVPMENLPAARELSIEASIRIIEEHPEIYGKVLKKTIDPILSCSVILISACQDTQLSYDSNDPKGNGVFTTALLKVLESGAFVGGYRQLRLATIKQIPKRFYQTPNYLFDGVPNKDFENQQPFTI